MPVIRILHLDDDPEFSRRMASRLAGDGCGFAVTRVDAPEAYAAALDTGLFHVVLAEHRLAGYDGLEALRHARRHHPRVPFVFLSREADAALAVDSLRRGATDCLLKDGSRELASAVARAVQAAEAERLLGEEQDGIRRDQGNLRALLENAADAIWSMDADCRIVAFNSAASLLAMKIGCGPLAPGCDFLSSVSDQARAWWQSVGGKIGEGRRVVEEYVLTWKGNRYRLEVSLSPLIVDGRAGGTVVVCREISHR